MHSEDLEDHKLFQEKTAKALSASKSAAEQKAIATHREFDTSHGARKRAGSSARGEVQTDERLFPRCSRCTGEIWALPKQEQSHGTREHSRGA